MKKILFFILFGLFFFSVTHQNGFVNYAEARSPSGPPPPPGIGHISGKKVHHISRDHIKRMHKAHHAHHHMRAKIEHISGKKIRMHHSPRP